MAEDQKNIDNLFREALDNYKDENPSRSVWRGVSAKMFLHDLLHLRLLNIPYFVPSAVTVIAAGILAFILFRTIPDETPVSVSGESIYTPENKLEQKSSEAINETQVTTNYEDEIMIHEESEDIEKTVVVKSEQSTSISEDVVKEEVAVILNEEDYNEDIKEEKTNTTEITQQKVSLTDAEQTIKNIKQKDAFKDISGDASEITSVEDKIEPEVSVTRQKAFNPLILSEKTALSNSSEAMLRPLSYLRIQVIKYYNPEDQQLSLLPYQEVTGANKSTKLFDYYTSDQYSVGFHFTLEKMYNSPDDQPDKNMYSVDFSFSYQMNKYIFQTGLGYSYSENDHNYKVNYQDYLGSYNELLSINFTFDTVTGRPVPIYTWGETDVYDTASQSLSTRVTNYYSSMQVPLLLGYELFSKNRFSVFVKGGPEMSLLLFKNEPDASYFTPNKRVTSIDYAVPSRTKVNWQFLGSVGIGFQVTNKIKLAIEPTIKYYFNPVYGRNKTADTRPYLLGLRTGIVYTIK